jgi:hypothetical protein
LNTGATESGPVAASINRLTEPSGTGQDEREEPKVLTLRRPDGEKTVGGGDRERMRTQLMAYLEERTAGRGN